MLKSAFAFVITAFLASLPLSQSFAMDDNFTQLTSPHSVVQTIDNLQNAVEAAGATVFARIDHAAGAKKAGMEIPANQVLIFGNPVLGTPIIQDAPTAGLDLPMRVSAYETDTGTVVTYHNPKTLAQAHGLPEDHPSIMKITGALAKLTTKAAE